MRSFINYVVNIFNRLVDFHLRRRTVAGILLAVGGAIAVAALGSGWVLGFIYREPGRVMDIKVENTAGVPAWAILAVLCVGISLIVVGAAIGIADWWRTRNAEMRRKSIIVELRGLHSSPDTSALTAILGLPAGQRDLHVVDFRPSREGELVNPELALEKLQPLKRAVEAACGGRAKEDVTVALGGLAAVPILFLTGMLFDDESNVVIYDWDRVRKIWRLTDDLDDGKRFLQIPATTYPLGIQEVILAVSASYAVDDQGIMKAFGNNVPVVHIKAEEMLIDKLWSEAKQQAYVMAFRDAVQRLMENGVKKIHLILAAPASLSIRMGMAYDRRLMPEIIVYQYERSAEPPYPWGIQMPTHGRLSATIERVAARA